MATADDNYKVLLNGVPIGKDGDNKTIEKWDEVPLKTGRNKLKFIVTNEATEAQKGTDNPAGLIYRLDISFDPS